MDGNNPIPENVTLTVITPGQKVNFTVPTLQIVTGLDPVIGESIAKNIDILNEINVSFLNRCVRISLCSGRAKRPTIFWCHDRSHLVRQCNCLRSHWFNGSYLHWFKWRRIFSPWYWALCIYFDFVLIQQALKFCPSDPETPKYDYIQFLVGEIVSFVNGVLDPVGNCALFDNLETNGLVGVNTENEFASNGWQRCSPLQCVLTPSSSPFFSFW